MRYQPYYTFRGLHLQNFKLCQTIRDDPDPATHPFSADMSWNNVLVYNFSKFSGGKVYSFSWWLSAFNKSEATKKKKLWINIDFYNPVFDKIWFCLFGVTQKLITVITVDTFIKCLCDNCPYTMKLWKYLNSFWPIYVDIRKMRFVLVFV